MFLQRSSDNRFEHDSKNCGETGIGIENRAVLLQGRSTLIHRFHQHSIGVFGALQGENLISIRTVYNDGIHLATLNGQKSLFKFTHARAQVFNFSRSRLARTGGTFPAHFYSFKSRPRSTSFLFDRSPTSLRSGSGSFLIRGGAATTCASLANS